MNNKMYKYSNPGTLLAIVLFMLAGCYPKGPEYYSDLDLTITDYDTEYNFGDQKNYWMADTIEYITNIEDGELKPADEAALLAEVENNLEDAGYIRVPTTQPELADFAITISVIASEYTGVGWVPVPPYFPGWGWGGWGGYYPPYWGGYYSYSYTTGSVFTHWYDPDSPPVIGDDGEEAPIHWVAVFDGLVSSSKDNNASRIEFSINQAFTQSPYIKSNK